MTKKNRTYHSDCGDDNVGDWLGVGNDVGLATVSHQSVGGYECNVFNGPGVGFGDGAVS